MFSIGNLLQVSFKYLFTRVDCVCQLVVSAHVARAVRRATLHPVRLPQNRSNARRSTEELACPTNALQSQLIISPVFLLAVTSFLLMQGPPPPHL